MPTPNRILRTLSSLGVSVDKILVVASPRLDLIACSKGAKAFVSSMKSPKLLSSSSPTGFSRDTGSLETPIGKEEDSRLGDFIEADIENPEQDVSKTLLREDLEGVLATLSPRERDVLRLRYGIDDGRMKTLEEIGQIFDVTRERIRQIEAKALRKLRHPNRNGVLKEYIK